MELYIQYDMNIACKKIMREQLDKLNLNYSLKGFSSVDIKDNISEDTLNQLRISLNNYGIDIIESYKSILVQKIKDAIMELVYMEDKMQTLKISTYLANKLNHSYSYISSLFSDVTFTSIENFIILQKIERVKQLINTDQYTITEIAWKLNYSSVAHLSNQFKNATGLTPTSFKRIINRRRDIILESK